MTTETYTVTGMTCGHCVSSVTEEVSELRGVQDVQVDLDSGRSPSRPTPRSAPRQVRAAVEEAGYTLAG
jgi:copper chaperone CopZ